MEQTSSISNIIGESIQGAFEKLFSYQLEPLPFAETRISPDRYPYMASVNIHGENFSVHVYLLIPEDLLFTMASMILGDQLRNFDYQSVIKDQLGELLNVVGGTVKAALDIPASLGIPDVSANVSETFHALIQKSQQLSYITGDQEILVLYH
mgnify:CR=1 FL=1